MEEILWRLILRMRPRVGWPQALLALLAASCPAFAAADSALQLPIGGFFWAGVVGVGVGMRGGRAADDPATISRRLFILRRSARAALWLIVLAGGSALLVLSVAGALPSALLVAEDVLERAGWIIALARRTPNLGAPPLSRSLIFLDDALPRALRALAGAPAGGESGARLMLAAGGSALTWAGALALGWGIGRRGRLLGWGVPLLVALALITVFSASGGAALVAGLGALLLLAIMTDFQRRAAGWDRSGVDFSDELRHDTLIWGGALVVAVLAAALLLPTWLDNPFAESVWRDVEHPSGLAVLERNIRRPQPAAADAGISKLPVLQLGMSLEQGAPETLALRVRLDAPLPAGPWPHYWRARLFDIYNGREWTTDARVGALAPLAPAGPPPPNAIAQTITDARADRQILVGLPDIIGVGARVSAERLPDGTLAALTGTTPDAQYRVLSRPQEFAPPPDNISQPPDLRAYLRLPGGLPPRVSRLAHEIIGERTDRYEQALALESYLRGLPYAYQVQPLPGGGDAVDQFLFDMRQGYCTYYASSMAVLARSLGIPARVATGYSTGSYDPSSSVYTVREADAHAWPELYLGGRWLPFEPTPIRPLPARAGDAPQQPAPEQAPQGDRSPLVWVALAALIALIVGAGVWLGLRLRPIPAVVRAQLDLERQGRQAGVPWPPGATLHEYEALLAPRLDGAAGALHELVELIAQARYSGRALHDDQLQRLRAAGREVQAQLGRRARR